MTTQPANPLSRKRQTLSDIGLLYAAAIWGSTFIVVKDALSGVDPVVMVGYRFLIAGGVLAVYARFKKIPLKIGWRTAGFLSLILGTLYVTQTIGLRYTSASNSGFITGLFVFFTPVFLVILFKTKPTFFEWIASIISLCGLWILTGGMRDVNVGDALTVICAMAYALHVLYSDKYMKRGADPIRISCQQFLLVGAMAIIGAVVIGLPMQVTTASAGWSILFLALFPTLSAFVIQMFAQRYTSPIKVTLIFALEPVFAALFAWTVGEEMIIAHRAMGGALIVVALALSGLKLPKNWYAKRQAS